MPETQRQALTFFPKSSQKMESTRKPSAGDRDTLGFVHTLKRAVHTLKCAEAERRSGELAWPCHGGTSDTGSEGRPLVRALGFQRGLEPKPGPERPSEWRGRQRPASAPQQVDWGTLHPGSIPSPRVRAF